jgi:hypothetical protein
LFSNPSKGHCVAICLSSEVDILEQMPTLPLLLGFLKGRQNHFFTRGRGWSQRNTSPSSALLLISLLMSKLREPVCASAYFESQRKATDRLGEQKQQAIKQAKNRKQQEEEDKATKETNMDATSHGKRRHQLRSSFLHNTSFLACVLRTFYPCRTKKKGKR